MKKPLLILLLINSLAFGSLLQSRAGHFSFPSQKQQVERPVYYKSNLQEFDFQLSATAKGEFTISFDNKTQKKLDVKVYDIIGNLIMEEKTSAQGKFVRAYDLSYYKSHFFLVEVSNNKHQKLKRVIAV